MSATSSKRRRTSSQHAAPDKVSISQSSTQTDTSQQATAATAGAPRTSELINALISGTSDSAKEQPMWDALMSSNLDDILESITMPDSARPHRGNVWSGVTHRFDVEGGNGNTARDEQLPPPPPWVNPADENLSLDELGQRFGLSPSPSLQWLDMDNDDDMAEFRRQLVNSNMGADNRGNGAFDLGNGQDFDFDLSGTGFDNTQPSCGGANAFQLSEEQISHAHDIADDEQGLRRIRSLERLGVPSAMDLDSALVYERGFFQGRGGAARIQ
ncbi:hypothetical protein L202_03204 [Cryptococcus amylolentus CBS 6039]|uniref:Uncharacterized protein n=1 Tax=Cryptococcus amylolentus CBS 6039 TaxID=1295533 RepID=A0A1E3HZX7_9TREE|nr:hypothetical protein L202_03204 [Cryptococcus amylolentus CBS 6039]ODN81111.1 hypothetical protein L202_03204 [Cryptococcus amylolentus CBS 6039]